MDATAWAFLALLRIDDPTDEQFVGAIRLADLCHDIALIRSAFQPKK